ncbi:MAG: glycolate oxidase subunit GlcF [Geminicoccaceae bacterium]
MQTNFTTEQLRDPDVAASEKILRTCVHCGFCTATCPTYTLLGDELDSPRGRIYLIKAMLENDRPADDRTVLHIDRCLSCLSCMTTCPSGVHYMHLVDHARKHIEETYRRPVMERLLRQVLAWVLPYPSRFRLALLGARVAKPFRALLPTGGTLGRVRAMLSLAPNRLPAPSGVDKPQILPAEGQRRGRVTLLNGCAQQVLNTAINEATIRLLRRHGIEVIIAKGAGCCGALVHHMGRENASHAAAKANIDAWLAAGETGGLDAVIINASGCGTTVKDYGFMLRNDPDYGGKAEKISAMTKDIVEFMDEIGLLPTVNDADMVVAYHSACSMQHGQQIKLTPKKLLTQAGFTVREPARAHLCCGSAGTYNILQPEIATQLRDNKAQSIERLKPDVIATGNIGCMAQLAGATAIPIVHTAELLDWATGGPKPVTLR